MRVEVPGKAEVVEHYAENISSSGLFIRTDTPEAPGTAIVFELVLPNGQPLCRLTGTVRHARPATVPGERHAGMGIEITQMEVPEGALGKRFKQLRDQKRAENRKRKTPTVLRTPPPARREGPIVGIDLGTSFSCVAAVKEGKPQVLCSAKGYQSIPSVMFLDDESDVSAEFEDDAPLPTRETMTSVAFNVRGIAGLEGASFRVGHQAHERMILKPDHAIYGHKRFLGRPYTSREVQTLGHFFTYQLVEGAEGLVAARVGQQEVPLESVSACLLLTLKEMAEAALGRPVHRAVITVPAYFGEPQREAVTEAAHRAGLHVERLVNEPTAAALAYSAGRALDQRVLIYDLGGGTFDVSVVQLKGEQIEVLAVSGEPFLGGSDFDDRLTEYLLMTAERSGAPEVRQDPVAVQRVRFAAELAKRQLSEVQLARVNIPHLASTAEGSIDLNVTVERELLEQLCADLVDRTLVTVDQALSNAGLRGDEIDEVILAGGQSRSPQVQRTVFGRFQRKPSQRVHPDEAVALGAAILGARIEGDRPAGLKEILPASIQICRPDGDSVVLFPRGARLPREQEMELSSFVHGGLIILYRGEAPRAEDNALLGMVKLPEEWLDLGEPIIATIKLSDDGLIKTICRDPLSGASTELKIRMRKGAG